MRLTLRFIVSAAVFSFLLAAPVWIAAQDNKNTGGPPKDNKTETTIPNKTEEKPTQRLTLNDVIVFPEVEDWQKGDEVTYPSPELGYSVTYQSTEGGRVTVYVYNAGLKNIPNDVNDRIIKNEIERAKNEIIQIGKAGYYDDVKEVKSETVTLGGKDGRIKALRSLFYFKVRGEAMDSEIYIFGYKNNFIKIRSTRPKTEGAANAALAELLAEIDKMFAQ